MMDLHEYGKESSGCINPLNAELNPIRHLLALVGARHIVHVSRIRVKEGNPMTSSIVTTVNYRGSS
jgi:hypothetical protein